MDLQRPFGGCVETWSPVAGVEPMPFGSTTSPEPGASAQFLPEFLMGNLPVPESPQTRALSGPAGGVMEMRCPLLAGGSPPQPLIPTHKDKSGAPPVRSLHDELSSPGLASTPLSSRIPAMKRTSTLGQSSLVGRMASTPGAAPSMFSGGSGWQPRRTTLSPVQPDRFYASVYSLSSEDRGHGRWVTVYGFPQASASYMLHHFAQYGKILKHVMSTTGNWLHICYETTLQARKALTTDGRYFGNSFRIGVRPCTDTSVMARSSTSPSVDGTGEQHEYYSTRFPTMRPLAPACEACASHCQVFLERQTPSTGGGLLGGRTLCPAGSRGKGLFLVFVMLVFLLVFLCFIIISCL